MAASWCVWFVEYKYSSTYLVFICKYFAINNRVAGICGSSNVSAFNECAFSHGWSDVRVHTHTGIRLYAVTNPIESCTCVCFAYVYSYV